MGLVLRSSRLPRSIYFLLGHLLFHGPIDHYSYHFGPIVFLLLLSFSIFFILLGFFYHWALLSKMGIKKNKLLALAFEALSELGFKVWFWKSCRLDQCFPTMFEIDIKFLWWKSDRILPYFHGGNPAALHIKCIIAHKMLFLSSFHRENMVTGVPHFHSENLTKFHVWCATAHWQGFTPVYKACAIMLVPRQAKAPQSIKHIDVCHIHGETNVTWWHGSGWSYRNDHAHNITWICTYNNCLEHIHTL